MNLELAESFFRNIYDTHIPSDWGSCNGEHEVEGFEAEQPSYPCNLYSKAAEVLGLPIVEWIRPKPKPRTPEQIEHDKAFYRIFGPLLEQALKPNPLMNELMKETNQTGTVTFRIKP